MGPKHGVPCPFCGSKKGKVLDSRSSRYGKRRKKECLSCGGRFVTYELAFTNVKDAHQTLEPLQEVHTDWCVRS